MICKNGVIKGNKFNERFANLNIVGNPTIQNNVVSNFGSANYLVTSYNINLSNAWEGHVKVKTGTITTQQMIFSIGSGNSNATRFGYSLYIWSNGGFGFNTSYNGTSWGITSQNNTAVQANTIYWLKFGWNKSAYYIKLSTDGITFNDYVSVNGTSPIYRHRDYDTIGVWHQGSAGCGWTGEIYLDEFYLSENGSGVYAPALDIPSISDYQTTSVEFYEI